MTEIWTEEDREKSKAKEKSVIQNKKRGREVGCKENRNDKRDTEVRDTIERNARKRKGNPRFLAPSLNVYTEASEWQMYLNSTQRV